jgi:hypothetical protein
MSAGVDVLPRWERPGGTWDVVGLTSDPATLALLRSDGCEEVDRAVLEDPEALELVRSRRSEPDSSS